MEKESHPVNTITYYQQTRVDGGSRIGIETNGDTLWGQFEPGNLEPDPALLWYVDRHL